MGPENVTAVIGTDVRFECNFLSDLALHVSWIKNRTGDQQNNTIRIQKVLFSQNNNLHVCVTNN